MIKKLIIASLIILAFCFTSQARAKYQGIAERGGKLIKTSPSSTYKLSETFPGCTVTVYRAGTVTLAPIYANNSGSVRANPFTSDSTDASYFFYVDDGRYDIKFSGTGVSNEFTLGDVIIFDSTFARVESNPYQFGAFGTGVSHTINSGDITSHPEWIKCEGNYVVGDEWDYVAIQEAICASFYNSTTTPNLENSRLNIPLHISSGIYLVNKAPTVTTLKSGIIYGDGRLATVIKSTADVAALRFNGVWYSVIRQIQFIAGATRTQAVVEVDGNYDNVHTLGTQANSFYDILVSGNAGLAVYGLYINRQGGNGAQGDHHEFYNCHFLGASDSCFIQNGFNVLNTNFYGGDFQSYSKNGIRNIVGSVNIYGTTFESTYGYTQIANSGYDVNESEGGAFAFTFMYGVRSESLAIYNGGNGQVKDIRTLTQTPAGLQTWNATTAYNTLNQYIIKTSSNLKLNLYRITTTGTSGLVEPAWPNSGTVVDGTIVWTLVSYPVVNNINGILEVSSIAISTAGAVVVGGFPGQYIRTITTTYTASLFGDEVLVGNTSSGAFTITLPISIVGGKKYYIKKSTDDANALTVSSGGNGIDGSTTQVIPGGSKGYMIVVYDNPTSSYLIISKSF